MQSLVPHVEFEVKFTLKLATPSTAQLKPALLGLGAPSWMIAALADNVPSDWNGAVTPWHFLQVLSMVGTCPGAWQLVQSEGVPAPVLWFIPDIDLSV